MIPERTMLFLILPGLLLVCGCTGESDGENSAGPEKAAARREPSAPGGGQREPGAPGESPRPAEIRPPAPKIEIPLPQGPPRKDPVENGMYVLSISIDLDNGGSMNQRHACSVAVAGEEMTIRLERSRESLVGSLRDGRLVVKARETPGAYGLEGQVTGPGKLAGRVVGGPALQGVTILDGRWSLQRVK